MPPRVHYAPIRNTFKNQTILVVLQKNISASSAIPFHHDRNAFVMLNGTLDSDIFAHLTWGRNRSAKSGRLPST